MTQEEVFFVEWIDETAELRFAELLSASGFSREQVLDLVDLGAIQPRGADEATWRFSRRALETLRAAEQLRVAFELDTPGLAFALGLLERIEDLQRRVRELECQVLR